MRGIDVSMHNGNVDYSKVKSSGIEVVIIKATEGVDYIDPYLERNYTNSKQNGLYTGFYHFMSEKTDPVRQAEDFFNSIKNKQYDVIPVLDIETNNNNRSSKEVTDRCLEFLNRFKALSGIDCVIYTGGYFGRDLLDDRIKSYKAWIAHYGVQQPMYTGFSDVVGHQYSEKGSVAGINGNVDLNNFQYGIILSDRVITSPTDNVGKKQVSRELIMDLQRACNAQGFSRQVVDGIVGPNTLAGCPLVREGARGNITKVIQQILGISSDGIFGPKTKAAVIAFQKSQNLAPDGIVGNNTWTKLLL